MIENFIITYITDYNPYLMEEATAVLIKMARSTDLK